MTALILAPMVTGASLLVAEAHMASYGLLGMTGVLALVAGGVLAVEAAEGACSWRSRWSCPSRSGSARWSRSRGARRWRWPPAAAGGADGLIGQVGIVRQALTPVGAVHVGGELWRAQESWDDGEPAPREDEHVVVERVHGLTLLVRRAEEWEVLP